MMIAVTVLYGPNDLPVKLQIESTEIESIISLKDLRVIHTKGGRSWITKTTEQDLLRRMDQAKMDEIRQAHSINDKIREEIRSRKWDESF